MQCHNCEGFGMVAAPDNDWRQVFFECPVCRGDGMGPPVQEEPGPVVYVRHRQSRAWSFGETCFSTAIGLVVALLTQLIVFPWFGIAVSFSQDIAIAAIFTVVSVIRGYCVRRLFEQFR